MLKKRYLQIDVMKGIAICMVLINHSYKYVYSTELLFKTSRSCVQIILFCAGINAFLKLRTIFSKDNLPPKTKITSLLWKEFWWPRLVSIGAPYIAFNISFYILWKRRIDWKPIFQYIIGFNIANPVYFIPVYLELVLCAPLVYYFICRFKTKLYHYLIGIISLVVCICFGKYTYMFPIYGGGQYLFGATYGWVFILGMMFGNKISSKEGMEIDRPCVGFAVPIPIGVLIFWVASLKLFPDAHANFEQVFPNIGGNPPGFDSLTEGFLLIWMIWTIATYIDMHLNNSKLLYYLTLPFTSCGKYSLCIFLWHMFIKAAWNQIINAYGLPTQSLLYAIPFYLGSTAGVIFVKKAFDLIKKDVALTCLKSK